jgi:putative ABC transport system ATP-binding protein
MWKRFILNSVEQRAAGTTQDAIGKIARVPNFAQWFDRHREWADTGRTASMSPSQSILVSEAASHRLFAQPSIHALEPCTAACAADLKSASSFAWSITVTLPLHSNAFLLAANSETLEPVIALYGVGKSYPTPAGSFEALDAIDLTIARGEFVAVVGQSGSGKSTLLNLLGGIDRPTRGDLVVDGRALQGLSERELSIWRGSSVGIVFQFFQLLPTWTAAENVMLPMDFANRWSARERRTRALTLLDRLGVVDQADKLPAALSGGQQQRVAVARALANGPAILLADEPTGNLDSRTAQSLLDVLAELVRDGQTVVMVTHERGAISHATRIVTLADGRIVGDEAQAHV